MKSDVITISSSGENMATALEHTRKVAEYKELSSKDALHLKLLAEEMMGMMRSITGETSGKFWIEDEDNEFQLHLKVDTVVNEEMRRQLLDASFSGKNVASRSLMGRLREFFFRSVDEELAAYDSPLLSAGAASDTGLPVTDWQWTLTRYQKTLSTMKAEKTDVAEAWDELEKSVVSHVADDVKISIKGWETEMIIVKKMAQEATA